MAVLIVLIGSMLIFRGLGALGVKRLQSWRAATLFALAAMLFFTATAHFTTMKEDLVRMVPSWVPNPPLIVFATGILEIAGGIGLLIPRTRRIAGIALILFFIAVFPANVHAARSGVSLGGSPATSLWLRAPMQILFIILTWWSAVRN